MPAEAFSFGVLLYELCTGKRPFSSDAWQRITKGGPEGYWDRANNTYAESKLFQGMQTDAARATRTGVDVKGHCKSCIMSQTHGRRGL